MTKKEKKKGGFFRFLLFVAAVILAWQCVKYIPERIRRSKMPTFPVEEAGLYDWEDQTTETEGTVLKPDRSDPEYIALMEEYQGGYAEAAASRLAEEENE